MIKILNEKEVNKIGNEFLQDVCLRQIQNIRRNLKLDSNDDLQSDIYYKDNISELDIKDFNIIDIENLAKKGYLFTIEKDNKYSTLYCSQLNAKQLQNKSRNVSDDKILKIENYLF